MLSAKAGKENDYGYIRSPSKEITCHLFSFQRGMTRTCRVGTAFPPPVFDTWAENKPRQGLGSTRRARHHAASTGGCFHQVFPAWFWPDTAAGVGTKKPHGNVLCFHWAGSPHPKQTLPPQLANPPARPSLPPCLHTRASPCPGMPQDPQTNLQTRVEAEKFREPFRVATLKPRAVIYL